jgi:hypothetical protein
MFGRKPNLNINGRDRSNLAFRSLALWLFSSIVGLLFFSANSLGKQLALSTNQFVAAIGVKLAYGGSAFVDIHQTTDGFSDLLISLTRRISMPGTWITLTILLLLLWGILSSGNEREEEIANRNEMVPVSIKPETFGLFMVAMGTCLTLFPEFFYRFSSSTSRPGYFGRLLRLSRLLCF